MNRTPYSLKPYRLQYSVRPQVKIVRSRKEKKPLNAMAHAKPREDFPCGPNGLGVIHIQPSIFNIAAAAFISILGM